MFQYLSSPCAKTKTSHGRCGQANHHYHTRSLMVFVFVNSLIHTNSSIFLYAPRLAQRKKINIQQKQGRHRLIMTTWTCYRSLAGGATNFYAQTLWLPWSETTAPHCLTFRTLIVRVYGPKRVRRLKFEYLIFSRVVS